MPKIYTRITWIDELLAEAERYNILEDNGTPFKSDMQIALASMVATAGTLANAAKMNNIEAGIDALDNLLVSMREAATQLIISVDEITITQSNHRLQPETGTADNLSTINGTIAGQSGVLYVSDFGTDTITIKHNVGNILCVGGADIALSNGCVFWYSNGVKVFMSGGGGGGGSGNLDLANSTELTIASGSITPTQSYHSVDTQSDASVDDLDTIVASGVTDGFVLILSADNTNRTTFIKHNTGNIVTPDGLDFALDDTNKFITLIYSSALTKWRVQLPHVRNGWREISESWSRASDSTITVPTDATTRHSKGIKIRFKQGGSYKYFVGRNIAATLITVVINTDYTVANSAITDIAISYDERPDGFPSNFAFTSVLAGSTTDPTGLTTTGKYTVNAGGIKVFISSVAGGSPTNGSGFYTWTVPFTSVVSGVGPMHISDANVGRFTGSVFQSGGSCIGITSAGLVTGASPIAALASGDTFDFSMDLLW